MKYCSNIKTELTAMNFSTYSDDRRPFGHICLSEDTTTRSMQRQKEAKCNSYPRITLQSDYKLRSIGHEKKRSKSIQGSASPFYKRRSYAKSSHNASFFTNGDTTQGMDLLQAMGFKRFGSSKDMKSESNEVMEAVSIRFPQKTKKNIFFYNKENLSRLQEDARPLGNSPASTDEKLNPLWKDILDTKGIFKLDFPPCDEINFDTEGSMNRSDSFITVDSMLAE